MKKLLLSIGLLTSTFLLGQSGDYPYRSVPFNQIKLTDNFWLPRIKTNHTVTIPASFERCENTGRVKNFIMAANKQGKFCTTYPFDDTDIYKTIEGASFSLRWFPDKKMEAYIDSLRGPLIYCAEWFDNSGKASNIILPETTRLTSEYKSNLLNGVTVINAEVPVVTISKNGEQVQTEKKIMTAIPYYAWANRGEGEMMIWFPQKVSDVALIPKN